MKKSLLLIGTVLAGMLLSAVSASARDCGCYAETRAEGISLCERGLHQRAIEFFVAAKSCNDKPSNNDLDALIAKCRSHLADFSISAVEFGMVSDSMELLVDYGETAFEENSIYYIKPRITYSSSVTDSLEFGIKFIKPGGILAGSEGAEYSYIQKVYVEEGTDNQLYFWGWGSDTAGSFIQGVHTVEIWLGGKCLASEQFAVVADEPAEPKITVNGETEINVTFSMVGGKTHIYVANNTGLDYTAWLLPDFCEVENVEEDGFDLVCNPNKTPVYKEDFFLVSDTEYENSARVNVFLESYANPTKLIVDNKEEGVEIYSSFSFEGGREIFFVDTDSPDYDFWGMPGFCSIDKKSETSFFLVCEPNPTIYDRSDYFKVQAGKLSVIINVTQVGNPDGISYEDEPSDGGSDDDDEPAAVDTYMGAPNVLGEPESWLEVLGHMMENPVKKYSDGSAYKGLVNDQNIREGYGVYYWPVKTYFFGEWKDGQREGMGIYLIGDFNYFFNNCPDAVVYVGEFKNSLANGIGSCYDKDGNLLYDGEFVDGVPQDDYPNGDRFDPGYKFQFYYTEFSDGSGQYYVGETYGTDRHGWGALIWSDFDCCFGRWSGNQRSSEEPQLFMERSGRVIEMRQY